MSSALSPSQPQTSAALPVPLRQDATIMTLVGIAHASSHFGHMLLPPLYPVFMKEFGLSFAQVGFLMTVFFLISGVGQALSGFLVDRFGARPILFAALSSYIAACLVAASAQNYSWLLASAALGGLGNSPYHPVDFTILNQRVSNQRIGHSFSMHSISGTLGWAVSPILLVSIMAVSDWRTAYLGAAALYALVLLTFIVFRQYLQTEPARAAPKNVVNIHTNQTHESPYSFLKLPVIWWCFTFFLFSTVTLAVIQSFAVPIFQNMHGVSLGTATAILTAYIVCSAIGIFTGGFVSSKFGAAKSDKVVAVCMTVGAVLIIISGSGVLGAAASMTLLASSGFAIGIGAPSRDMMIKRAAPKGATGRVYGTVYSGLDIGFAVAPLVFGLLMDRKMYAATLTLSALALLIAVAAALAVGRRSTHLPPTLS